MFRVSDVRGPRTKTCVALESIVFLVNVPHFVKVAPNLRDLLAAVP